MEETVAIEMNSVIDKPTWEDFYFGSRRFQFIADAIGLPIDQVNFLLGQFLALLIAYLFRVLMHPSNVSSTTRHWTALSAGLCISYFCFGKQMLLAVGLVVICYCLLMFLPVTTFHHVTLFVSMSFLSAIHIQRQYYEDGSFVIDITAPLMIIVQKTTSLAYSLHDGLTKDEKQLTDLQKKFVVRSKPSTLEYFSYLLCFQSILAGPYFMFTDYQDFIEGTQYIKYEALRKKRLVKSENEAQDTDEKLVNNNNPNGICKREANFYKLDIHSVKEPNPTSAAIKKYILSLSCALVVILIYPLAPVTHLSEQSFLSTSFSYKLMYIMITTTLARNMYYTAWYLADAVCSMSGLGFNGYSDKGEALWDRVANVDFIGVEFGTSLKSTLESWNIGTMRWLRFLVYERAPFSKTIFTYFVSSLWHGFYLGYYLTFFGGAFFTIASRTVRRCIRPRVVVLGSTALKVYHVITTIVTRFCLSYVTFPFVLLRFWPSIRLYSSLWFYFHAVSALAMVFLPIILPPIKLPDNRSRPVEAKNKLN